MYHRQTNRGFTLIEILLVVAAIVILAGIVVASVNPGRQLGKTRDADRNVAVDDIASAIQEYQLDNNEFPSTLPSSGQCSDDANEICKTGATSTSGCIDLSADLVDTYMPKMPVDLQATSSENGTGYHAVATSSSRVTVCAPLAEDGTISTTK